MARSPLLALSLFGLVASLGACSCGPAAMPVTLRVRNTLDRPIYVQDDQEKLGTSIARDPGSGFEVLAEAPCACQLCDQACKGFCNCTFPPHAIRVIAPGESVARTWPASVPRPSQASCFGSQKSCTQMDPAPLEGRYQAKLCYATEVPAGSGASGPRFPGQLPPTQVVCAARDFDIIEGGDVELTPELAPSCQTSRECGSGLICQAGKCGDSCLPHDLPQLSGTWTVEAGQPADQGFFATRIQGERTVHQGSGSIGALTSSAGATRISLVRDLVGGGRVSASLYVTLPATVVLPLTPGMAVDAMVVEMSSGPRQGALAARLSDASGLLLAADMGWGGPLLSAQELAPFSVDPAGMALACDPMPVCLRKIHQTMVFGAQGLPSQELKPGQGAVVSISGQSFSFLPVADFTYAASGCGASPVSPYVLVRG